MNELNLLEYNKNNSNDYVLAKYTFLPSSQPSLKCAACKHDVTIVSLGNDRKVSQQVNTNALCVNTKFAFKNTFILE